ncbi:MAG: lipopolysaccharide heptosyltransferase family protein, partial [Candidatus Electrothrix sp. AR1]|nr:lipopolysaccharide heptosyltransferase family protein [Candidatus Electrothrix sp. AR1]
FLYESGFFIGNDSGGGHLASCLDIPVLSIHGRKGKSRVWRPGWGQVEVVTPLINVIGGSLRQHFWKYFLSVSAVERGFERLTKQGSPKIKYK